MLKVRLTYWWWIVKYGGKKNIPRELIFGRMIKSMSRMSENLEKALRAMPPDTSSQEMKQLINLIRTAKELEQAVDSIDR